MLCLIYFVFLIVVAKAQVPNARDSDTRKSLVQIKILLHNIRGGGSVMSPGELPWVLRRRQVSGQFVYHSRHNPEAFVCLNEAQKPELDWIMGDVNKETHAWVRARPRRR